MSESGKIFSDSDFLHLLQSESVEKPKSSPRIGIIAWAAVGGLTFTVSALSFPFILPSLRRFCLPFVPATKQQVRNVMEALKGRSGKLIDLGSGDGRIVLAAAKEGFDSTGVELNPWLVLYSKWLSINSGLQKKTTFHTKDLWTFNLTPYENVVIFGVDTMMRDLEKKFQKELDEGTQVITCRYPLPYMKPDKTVGVGIDKEVLHLIEGNAQGKMENFFSLCKDKKNYFLKIDRKNKLFI